MNKLKRVKDKKAILPQYLNWLFFEKHYVITKNSLLLAFYSVEPAGDYYNGSADEKVVEAFNRFCMNLPDETALWYEWKKYRAQNTEYKGSGELFKNSYTRRLEELRTVAFQTAQKGFETRRYFCLSLKPSIGKTGIEREAFERFERILSDMEGRFEGADIKIHRMNRDEVCTYLHSIISTKNYQISTPSGVSMSISDTIWDDDIDPTSVPLRLGEDYIQIVSVDDFPAEGTSPEMLAEITKLAGDIRWVTRFVVRSSDAAKKIIDDKRRKYLSRRYSGRDIVAHTLFKSDIELEDTSALSRTDECTEALGVNGDKVNFGFYSGTFVIKSKTEERLRELSHKLQLILAKHHFIYREETMNLFSAWIGSLPGNLEANPRRQFISTGNLACVLSLTAPYRGEKENAFLKSVSGLGAPNATGRLQTGEFYYLNLNGKSDLGHSFIIGPSGAGKSILLAFLAASWTKYPQSRIIFFDKGLSSGTLVKESNGKIINPGKDQTSFLPLKDAAKDSICLQRAVRFLESIASVNNIELKPIDVERIITTLKLLVPGQESLSIFRQMLMATDHDSDFVAILRNYCEEGSYGFLFDSDLDNFEIENQMMAIEMGTLMELSDKAIIPALTYIFGYIMDKVRDCKPTLLIFDEAWIFMKNQFMKEFLIECLKTLRKYNTFMVLATQEVSDYSSMMESILTNTHTLILLPNEKALTGAMSSIYFSLGLEESDLAIIAGKTMSPKKNYYIVQSEGKAVIDLCLDQEQVKLLGGRIQ